MAFVVQVILRTVVVAGAGLLVGYLLNQATPEGGGANIGAGLISFLVIFVLSLVWAFVDGRRWRAVGRVVLVWAAVAVIVAVAMVVEIQMHGSGVDSAVMRSDLQTVAPFLFGLVLVPATVGGVLGSLLAPREAAPTA